MKKIQNLLVCGTTIATLIDSLLNPRDCTSVLNLILNDSDHCPIDRCQNPSVRFAQIGCLFVHLGYVFPLVLRRKLADCRSAPGQLPQFLFLLLLQFRRRVEASSYAIGSQVHQEYWVLRRAGSIRPRSSPLPIGDLALSY